jgi:hypothetical protein
LVLFPAIFEAQSPDSGVLRAFETIQLRIYYEDLAGGEDWRAPVIHRVEMAQDRDRVRVAVRASDPESGAGQPSGVTGVLVTYSTDDVHWDSDVILTQDAGALWTGEIDLPPGSDAGSLQLVVQAVDGAGNVAYSSNKGRLYRGVRATFLPLLF